MVSTSSSQYLNELISEMRRISEVSVDCKHTRILLSKEIARVFDEIQKIGGFGENRQERSHIPSRMSHFSFQTPSTSLQPKPAPSSSSCVSPFSMLSKNQFVTPIKPIKRFTMNQDGDWQESTPKTETTPESASDDSQFVLQTKIYIPEAPKQLDGKSVKCNYIGRILGPSGISARMIENQFNVTLLIRGSGSIRHNATEEVLRGKKGYEHLDEPLHVLLIARNPEEARCKEILDAAATKVEGLLTPVHDEYKKDQLVHYAIMNGTYEQRPKKNRESIDNKQKVRTH